MIVVEVVLMMLVIFVINLVMVFVEGFCFGISLLMFFCCLFLLFEEFFLSIREMKSLVMDGILNGWLFLLECGIFSSIVDCLVGGVVMVIVF